MAGSVNKVILVGNLGKDPEVHSTQTGSKIVSFTLATSETWNDRASGERKERAEWHRVVVFDEPNSRHSRALPDEGREGLRRGPVADPQVGPTRSGQEHYTTEVVVPRFKGAMTMLSPCEQRRTLWTLTATSGGGYLPRGVDMARAPIRTMKSRSRRRYSEPPAPACPRARHRHPQPAAGPSYALNVRRACRHSSRKTHYDPAVSGTPPPGRREPAWRRQDRYGFDLISARSRRLP